MQKFAKLPIAVTTTLVWIGLSLPPTQAAAATSEEILTHHFASINKGDLDGILSDYAEDAVMITPGGVIQGKSGIRGVYARMTGNGTKGVAMQVITKYAASNVAYATWTQSNGTQKAAATLVVQDGKIIAQTVVTGLIVEAK